MPSTRSSSFSSDLPSSTVITPSLPTLSIASEMILPMLASRFAEIEPTWAISLEVVQGLEIFFSSSTTATTALSMPRFRSIGFMPEATNFMPSRTMAWARTVAVVVPSPATSEVLEATSFTICAPMFSNLSFSSISLATETPSLVTVGAPNERSSTTLRPLGPSVTFTASARMFNPWTILARALSWKRTSLAGIAVSPSSKLAGCAYAPSMTPMMSSSRITSSSSPFTLTVWPEYLPNSTRSPTLTSIGINLPLSSFLPLPTATISPWSGFSAAVSGMTMPPADLRSSSMRLTITRSCNGRIFMMRLPPWASGAMMNCKYLAPPSRLLGLCHFLLPPLPVRQLILGGDPVCFLDLAGELVTLSCDHVQQVVGKRAPLLLGATPELLPVAFDLIPAHLLFFEVFNDHFRSTAGHPIGERPGAGDLDSDAPVGPQAGDDFRVLTAGAFAGLGNRLLGAPAFGAHAVGLDAFADQIGLDRFGAVFGEDLVVALGTQAVGVTDGPDHPEGGAIQPAEEVIQRSAALGSQLVGVEIKQRTGIEHYFFDLAFV